MGWTLTSTPAPPLGPPLLPGTPWTTTTLRPGRLNQPRLRLAMESRVPRLHPPAKSQEHAKRTASARPRRMRTTEQLAMTVMLARTTTRVLVAFAKEQRRRRRRRPRAMESRVPTLHPPAKSQGRAKKRMASARPRRMRTTEQLVTTEMQTLLGTPALTARVLECHLLRPPVRTSCAPMPRVRVKSQGRAKRRMASARPRRMQMMEPPATMAMTTLPATSARAVCARAQGQIQMRRRQRRSPRRLRHPRLLSTARGPGLRAAAHARENTPSPLLLSMVARIAPSPT